MSLSDNRGTVAEQHTRIIWPGKHKNAIRATVTRIDKHVWIVNMSDRFVYGVSVTSYSVRAAWDRALRAMVTGGL